MDGDAGRAGGWPMGAGRDGCPNPGKRVVKGSNDHGKRLAMNYVWRGDLASMEGSIVERYTRVAMLLHWSVALLIFVNVTLGWGVGLLADDWVRPAINLHKSIGLTVLALVVLRILWRLTHRPPPLPAGYPRLERMAAHGAHALLYVVILGLPVSGYLHDSAFSQAARHPLTLFGLIEIPRLPAFMALDATTKTHVHAFWFGVHVWLGYVLYVLLGLHVAGALKHQLVDRTPELRRMFS